MAAMNGTEGRARPLSRLRERVGVRADHGSARTGLRASTLTLPLRGPLPLPQAGEGLMDRPTP